MFDVALAWHKDALVRIQRIRDVVDILPRPVRQTVLVVSKRDFRAKRKPDDYKTFVL